MTEREWWHTTDRQIVERLTRDFGVTDDKGRAVGARGTVLRGIARRSGQGDPQEFERKDFALGYGGELREGAEVFLPDGGVTRAGERFGGGKTERRYYGNLPAALRWLESLFDQIEKRQRKAWTGSTKRAGGLAVDGKTRSTLQEIARGGNGLGRSERVISTLFSRGLIRRADGRRGWEVTDAGREALAGSGVTDVRASVVEDVPMVVDLRTGAGAATSPPAAPSGPPPCPYCGKRTRGGNGFRLDSGAIAHSACLRKADPAEYTRRMRHRRRGTAGPPPGQRTTPGTVWWERIPDAEAIGVQYRLKRTSTTLTPLAEMRARYVATEAPGGYVVEERDGDASAFFRTLNECAVWTEEHEAERRRAVRAPAPVAELPQPALAALGGAGTDAPAKVEPLAPLAPLEPLEPADVEQLGRELASFAGERFPAPKGKKGKKREYAPSWRRAGAVVNAKLRRSERGYRRGERITGIWAEQKGTPGMRVPNRQGPGLIFLVASVALADTHQADASELPPELAGLAPAEAKAAVRARERREQAAKAGAKGGRPALPDDERREVVALRLPLSIIEGAKEIASAGGEKPTRWMADVIAQAVNAGRKHNAGGKRTAGDPRQTGFAL